MASILPLVRRLHHWRALPEVRPMSGHAGMKWKCVIFLYGGWVLTRYGRRHLERKAARVERIKPELYWRAYWQSARGRAELANNDAVQAAAWEADHLP